MKLGKFIIKFQKINLLKKSLLEMVEMLLYYSINKKIKLMVSHVFLMKNLRNK